MKKNEYISLYVYTNGDNSWTLHDESGFGCHLLSGLYGFHADMSSNMGFNTGWHSIRTWRTSGTSTLYAKGGGASQAGYTVPDAGYYVCPAQLRFDSASGDHFRVVIA